MRRTEDEYTEETHRVGGYMMHSGNWGATRFPLHLWGGGDDRNGWDVKLEKQTGHCLRPSLLWLDKTMVEMMN